MTNQHNADSPTAPMPDWGWLILMIVSNYGAYRRGRRSTAPKHWRTEHTDGEAR